MANANLISPKVIAGALGGGAGLTISGFIVWLIGAGLYQQGFSSDQQDAAVAVVPSYLVNIIYLGLTLVGITVPAYQVTDPARVNSSSLTDQTFEGKDYDLDNLGVGPDSEAFETVNPDLVDVYPQEVVEFPVEVETSEDSESESDSDSPEEVNVDPQPSAPVPVIGSPPHS